MATIWALRHFLNDIIREADTFADERHDQETTDSAGAGQHRIFQTGMLPYVDRPPDGWRQADGAGGGNTGRRTAERALYFQRTTRRTGSAFRFIFCHTITLDFLSLII